MIQIRQTIANRDFETFKKLVKEIAPEVKRSRHRKIREWILETGDIEFIKKCISERQTLGWTDNQAAGLIIGTGNTQFIKNCIEDRENFKLYSDVVARLIKNTGDSQYIKNCIENRASFGFNADNLCYLIRSTEDNGYIRKCIAQNEELGIDSPTLTILVLETVGFEHIKECIKDNTLQLDSTTITNLILISGDLEYIEKLRMFDKKTAIKLPPEMTFGIEIESEICEGNCLPLETENFIKEVVGKTSKNWDARGDVSLKNGIEVVSPILTGKSESSSDEIRRICALLNGFSQAIDETCGGHIHIGADYLTSKQDWINLIKIWGNAEKMLYTICNEPYDTPRSGTPKYAKPISRKIQTAIEEGTINLDGEEDLEEFVTQVIENQKKDSELDSERYYGINFLNIGDAEKNTIEFRLPNGTINPNTWIENINLFGGIVRRAHELSAIQEKPEEQKTEAERTMIEKFNILTVEQDEEKVLRALLELCVEPEQRPVYMNRYRINKPLLESYHEITMQISTSKIGKKVFTGKDALNGFDYQQGAKIIEGELARNNVVQEITRGGIVC